MKKFFAILLVCSIVSLILTTGCTDEESSKSKSTDTTVTERAESTTYDKTFDYSIKENKYINFLGKTVQTVIDEFGEEYTQCWDGGWSYISYKNVPFKFAYTSNALDQNKLLKDEIINSIVIENEKTNKIFPVNKSKTINTMSTYGELKSAGVEGKLYITEGDIYFFSFNCGNIQVRYRYDNIDDFTPVCVYFNLT
ncbi:MAG: hypothetical protein PUE67_06860 [Oscillospiraceae bacterium]|nr:hypothetical protein [Oscillospiraceae bacterium]